jgi:hypothetical protein
VLDRPRVRAMLDRLSEAERDRAIEGLALLARAAQEEMDRFSKDRGTNEEHRRAPL